MASIYQWSRATDPVFDTISVGNGVFRQQYQAPAPFAGATLRRVIMDAQMNVVATAGTNPIYPDWWQTAYLEFRALWSHNGSVLLPALDARTEIDLGRMMLRPQYWPSIDESVRYSVTFRPDQILDVETARRTAADETPSVWVYTYYQDRLGGLTGTYDANITINSTLDVLWSRSA